MTTELNASQTERGAETGTNVGQPWEAKFMDLDRLLTWMDENKGVDAPWGIAFDEIRPEVEALQARVRELEGMLRQIRNIASGRATLEGKDLRT